jgi:hypothetical protein
MIKKDYASLSAAGGSKAVPFVQKNFKQMKIHLFPIDKVDTCC